jgi:hypothetical protein
MRRSRVGGLFGVVAAFAGGALPAETPPPMRVAVSPGGELYVVGTDADDQVRFTRNGDVYQLEAGKGPALRAGGGCRQNSPKVAECPVAGVTRITVTTADGLDQVLTSGLELFTVPLAISTGPGHDYVQLYGVAAPVAVNTGAGDDFVISGAGADRVDGGEGDDQISGMSGADTLLGGPGDDFLEDMIRESPPTTDTLDCGPGVDEPRAELGIDVMTACEQPPSEWSVWASSSRVKYSYRRFRDGTTKFTRVRVSGTPAGSDVIVECRGRSCPSPTWRARRTTAYSLDGLGPLDERHLRPRTRVTVTVVRPGSMTKVVRFTIRPHRAPALSVHCIGPISGIVTRAACRAAGLPNPGRFNE